jgi:oligopeptide transport system permease protein
MAGSIRARAMSRPPHEIEPANSSGFQSTNKMSDFVGDPGDMILSDVRQSAGGLWADAAARIKRNPIAVIAGSLIVLLAVLALAGPALSPYAYDTLDWEHLAAPPLTAASHWLGTDRLGRDLFVRSLDGVRISLLIGVVATGISLAIGLAWGAIAGYVGGRVDELMMRFVDVLYSLPYLFIVIILMTLFQRGSLPVLFCAIGAVGWLTTARIVRGQTLALKGREFVEAARAAGMGATAILLRHVIPNLAGPLVVYATLTLPQMILLESFLSFLGLGVQEPLASLGSLINDGAQEMQSAPWMLLVPAGFLVVLLICFNLVGDAARDALDPRER